MPYTFSLSCYDTNTIIILHEFKMAKIPFYLTASFFIHGVLSRRIQWIWLQHDQEVHVMLTSFYFFIFYCCPLPEGNQLKVLFSCPLFDRVRCEIRQHTATWGGDAASYPSHVAFLFHLTHWIPMLQLAAL